MNFSSLVLSATYFRGRRSLSNSLGSVASLVITLSLVSVLLRILGCVRRFVLAVMVLGIC